MHSTYCKFLHHGTIKWISYSFLKARRIFGNTWQGFRKCHSEWCVLCHFSFRPWFCFRSSSPALHLLPSSSSFSSSSLQFERLFFFHFHLAFSALLCPTQGESTSFQTQPYFSNTSWSLESTSRPHTLYRLLLCELVCVRVVLQCPSTNIFRISFTLLSFFLCFGVVTEGNC